jgi:hypothetical protein
VKESSERKKNARLKKARLKEKYRKKKRTTSPVQKLEPTNSELLLEIRAVSARVDQLIEAGRESGVVGTPVDYQALRKYAGRIDPKYVTCYDPCLQGGPCPDGRKQGLKCLDAYHAEWKKKRLRKLMTSQMPFSRKKLYGLSRKYIISLAAMMGLSPFDYKGDKLYRIVYKKQKKWLRSKGLPTTRTVVGKVEAPDAAQADLTPAVIVVPEPPSQTEEPGNTSPGQGVPPNT